MNIFLTHTNPQLAAQDLDNLRLNKMILETGQLICSAYRKLFAGEFPGIYKDTHVNHPCAIWARKNELNFQWLCIYLYELNSERLHRLGKKHVVKELDSHQTYLKLVPYLGFCQSYARYKDVGAPDFDISMFTFDCSNVMYPHSTLTERYQVCLADKWRNDKKQPSWSNRGAPQWLSTAQVALDEKLALRVTG